MLNHRVITVVVPAYQEEAHIGRVIRTMPAFVDHILVIDDASLDRTSEIARRVGDRRVRIVRHPRRRGVGAAIATGYAATLALTSSPEDAIAVMAGDGQMSPDDLETVATPIVTGGADYVKGSRFGERGVHRTMGLPRWIGGQVFSQLTSLAVGQPISDSQCGFTAISRRTILWLDLPGLWPSFGYPNDLLGQLGARGARIQEVPVRAIYGSEISKLRLCHVPPIFFLIARAATRRAYAMRTAQPSGVARSGDADEKELHRTSAVSS